MAVKVVKPKNSHYGDIQRGCSFMLPVVIKSDKDEPINLSGYTVVFTVKKVQSDFDRYDDFAYIKKELELEDGEDGSFTICLTSADTDFEPGQYYFDIELCSEETGMVTRFCTLTFNLVGGPSNRMINPGGGQLMAGETVTVITMATGAPIIIIAPTVAINADMVGIVQKHEEDLAELMKMLADWEQFKEEFGWKGGNTNESDDEKDGDTEDEGDTDNPVPGDQPRDESTDSGTDQED